jgi:hypothetical protein
MKLKNILLLTGIALTTGLSAQTYFQQQVDYKIDVTLHNEKRELSAFETIEYKNNSNETLTFIWFHLWPNAYKNNSTALGKQLLQSGDTKFYYAEDKDRGYIDSLNFTSNGTALKLEYHPQYIDVAKVYLAKPLAPGESVSISTPFKVKIPLGIFSRLGHIGNQYQITQWYPKPAVLDAKGWHEMPYLNQGEFYSEYGSFEVKITVPDNYVVAATGDLQEQKEKDWLEERVKNSLNPKFKPDTSASSTYKTITYKQTNVHDFAWFADYQYLIAKSEVELPVTKRKVETFAYYTPKYKKLWEKAPTYINDAVYYYSKWNGEYPYNHCSAVDGALSAGGGMEYPNVTVIGAMNSDFSLETVIMHEVGHNWFYGILGSNERENGWMDEGINSFNEMRYIYTKYPEKGIDFGVPAPILKAVGLEGKKNRFQYYVAYLFSKRQNADQPIQTHAAEFTELNYGTIMYMKTATVFDYLKAYLGDSTFDNCMHKYFDKWKFKHPQPEDLRKIFEDETGKNLSWFFDDMIKTAKRVDYKIRAGRKGSVVVKNRGEVAGPFALSAVKDGKVISTKWFEGFKGKRYIDFDKTKADKAVIDADERMPEVQRKNNVVRTTGMFKAVEPVKLKLLGGIEDPRHTNLYIAPLIGWNYYNHAMFGLAFYNHTIPQRKFEYTLMPMYATGTKSLNGEGSVAYNILPKTTFRQITLRGYVASYHYEKGAFGTNENLRYTKIAPEILFDIKKKPANSNIKQSVRLRYVYIIKDVMNYSFSDSAFVKGNRNYGVFDYTYTFENKRAIQPFGFEVHLQHNKDMVKTFAEAKYFVNYSKRKRSGLEVRLFAGAFLYKSAYPGIDYRFRLSGQTGFQDYLYDNIFLGRNEGSGVLFNQFSQTDGSFKMWSALGQTNNWIVSLNLKSSLPGKTLEKLPIKLYASMGTYDKIYGGGKSVAFEVGPYLSFGNFLEIYFPGFTSKVFRDAASINGIDKYYERIRFTLNFKMLRPFEMIKNINF